MNNDALVAALGMDAVAAVNGYRHAVRTEATQRGLCGMYDSSRRHRGDR